MNRKNVIEIIGVPIFDGDIPMAVEEITALVTETERAKKANACISATGAHGIVEAKKDRGFNDLLHRFHLNLADGMPGVWLAKMKGAAQIRRCYGPDVFAAVMKATADEPVSHFLCGGGEGVAGRLQKACAEKFGNRNIAGTLTPPFKAVDDFDYKSMAEEINRSGADIVWVGLGTPKQEQFAWKLSRHTDVHALITIGAAFDFYIGNVKQAPGWMQKAGLEWFFRLCTEPRRLFRRYVEIVPKFLFYAVADYASFLLQKIFQNK